MQKLQEMLENNLNDSFTKDELKKIIMPEAEKLSSRGLMLWPMRAALSGLKASPGPFEIAEILGKQKTLARIKKAIEILG